MCRRPAYIPCQSLVDLLGARLDPVSARVLIEQTQGHIQHVVSPAIAPDDVGASGCQCAAWETAWPLSSPTWPWRPPIDASDLRRLPPAIPHQISRATLSEILGMLGEAVVAAQVAADDGER